MIGAIGTHHGHDDHQRGAVSVVLVLWQANRVSQETEREYAGLVRFMNSDSLTLPRLACVEEHVSTEYEDANETAARHQTFLLHKTGRALPVG